MNQQTQVHNVKIRSRASRLQEPSNPISKAVELPERKGWGNWWLKADRLLRDLAVAGGLFLVVIAARNASLPETQSVFGALQTSAGMSWDESIGKLSFVNSFLPESIQTVWNETSDLAVFVPVNGKVVHAWSATEPYMLLETTLNDVRASADGEVMSIAHGIEEERIVRIRHHDGTEAVYGNLENCYYEIGDNVYAGDVIGVLMQNHPLAYELRVNGRSIDPADHLMPIAE